MKRPINPYVAGTPLRGGKKYFGRQDLMEWLMRELQNSATRSIVLSGQRRIGKTTLLLQLEHKLAMETFLPIYFDLQDQAAHPLDQVLKDLAESILEQSGLELKIPPHFDKRGRKFIQEFLPNLLQALGNERRIIFLFDEFDVLDKVSEESLPDTSAEKGFFPFLRSILAQENDVAFVFVVGRRAEDLSLDFTATFKASLAREIWVLDKPSAEELVRQAEENKTLRFSDEAVETLLSLTSCHPYLTQLLCQRIWERAYRESPSSPPTIGVSEVKSAVSESLEAGNHPLTWLWNGLSPVEKIYAAALAEVSSEAGFISESQVIEVLASHAARLRVREIELAPKDLVQRRVLEATGNKTYRFAVEFFRVWVRKNRPLRDVKNELDRIEPVAEQLFKIGQRFFISGEWETGVRYFKDSLKVNPRHFRSRFHLGQALLEMEMLDEAIVELKSAHELDQDEARFTFARALESKAKKLAELGDEEGALYAAEEALRISPYEKIALQIRESIWQKRGKRALDEEKYDEAIVAFQKSGGEEQIAEIDYLLQKKSLEKMQLEALQLEDEHKWSEAASLYMQLIASVAEDELKENWSDALERCREEEFLANLFDNALEAFKEKNWQQAQNGFAEVIYNRPKYRRNGQYASEFLNQIVSQEPILARSLLVKTLIGFSITAILLVVLIVFGINQAIYRPLEATRQVRATAEYLAIEPAFQETITANNATVQASIEDIQQTATSQADAFALYTQQSNESLNATATAQMEDISMMLQGTAIVQAATGTIQAATAEAGKITIAGTPHPESSEIISRNSVNRLGQLAQWGLGQITSELAFSPDGTIIATGSTVGIYLHESDTLEEVNVLKTNSRINSVSFSPDGTLLASGSDDNQVRLWQVEDGLIINMLEGHTHSVNSVSFSPDGTLLASGSDDNQVYIWRVEDGTLLKVIETHTNPVNSVVFSPDGTILATATGDFDEGAIRLWQVSDWSLLTTFADIFSNINKISFSPDGTLLAAGLSDNSLYLWQLNSEEPFRRLDWHDDSVTSVAFSPSGTILASGSEDATVQVTNVETNTLLLKLREHNDSVIDLKFSPDGAILASVSEDNYLRLWLAENGQLLNTVKIGTDRLDALAFSPDGLLLASGSNDNNVYLLQTEDGELLSTFEGHTNSVDTVSFSPDGTLLASGSDDNQVRLWRVDDGSLKDTFSGMAADVNDVAFSPDGTLLAASSSDEILIWQVSDGTLITTLGGRSGIINTISFSPQGDFLASGTSDGSVFIWQIDDNTLLHTIDYGSYIYDLTFSPDGTLASSLSNTIQFWNLDEFRPQESIWTGAPARNIAFSPDGTSLASGIQSYGIQLFWITANGNVLSTLLNGHSELITNVIFSPDGDMLASSSSDGTIRLWGIRE